MQAAIERPATARDDLAFEGQTPQQGHRAAGNRLVKRVVDDRVGLGALGDAVFLQATGCHPTSLHGPVNFRNGPILVDVGATAKQVAPRYASNGSRPARLSQNTR